MLYDFTARMHEDDIVYIHQRAQRAGIALKTKYSPLVDMKLVAFPSGSEIENKKIKFKSFDTMVNRDVFRDRQVIVPNQVTGAMTGSNGADI